MGAPTGTSTREQCGTGTATPASGQCVGPGRCRQPAGDSLTSPWTSISKWAMIVPPSCPVEGSATTREFADLSADLGVVRTNERDGNDRGNIALVGPAVARSVLDVRVAGAEGDLGPVVKLEIGFS